MYYWLGDNTKAQQLFQESVILSRDSGQNFTQYWGYVRLGYAHMRLEEDDEARSIFAKCLHLFQKMGSLDGLIFTMEGMASLAVRHKQPALAARFFGWANAARLAIQDSRPHVEQTAIDEDTAVIIDMIGQQAYAAAHAAGQKLTTDQAIAEALELEVDETQYNGNT
jgi:tetratricopeptide (TPR) repeat protein